MHIGLVSMFFPEVGGVSTSTYEIGKELQKRHDVTVLCGNTKHFGEREYNGLTVFDLPMKFSFYRTLFFNKRAYDALKTLIRDSGIEIIHFQYCLFTMNFELMKKGLTLPSVTSLNFPLDLKGVSPFDTFSSIFYRNFIKRMLRNYIRNTDYFVTTCKKDYDAVDRFSIGRDRVFNIPLGVNTEYFSPGASSFRETLDADNVFLFVGRVSYQKGVLNLARAFRRIEREFPRTKLVIVGNGPDMLRIRSMCSSNVVFTGEIRYPDKRFVDVLRAADCFVCPSLGESFGLVAAEAMACGLPVIGTDQGEVGTFIDKDLLITTNEPTVLADRMRYAIENKEALKKNSKNYRKRVVQAYSWTKTVNSLEHIYNTL